MDVPAKLTSKGQVTVPQAVREALGLESGDVILFRVEEHRAIISKTPDFLSMAGSLAVPEGKRGMAWDDVLAATYAARAKARR